jgi:hypothetical protein
VSAPTSVAVADRVTREPSVPDEGIEVEVMTGATLSTVTAPDAVEAPPSSSVAVRVTE